MTYALGIDLGTTFTAASISSEGRTEISARGRVPDDHRAVIAEVTAREGGEPVVVVTYLS